MIKNLSVSDLFWGEIVDGRISFRFRYLPPSIHFTLSFNSNNSVNNFHISKNTGDGKNKPQIRIAEFGKDLVDEITPFIPTLIFTKMYQSFSFKKHSRKSRKKIRLVFLDDLDKCGKRKHLEDKIMDIFKNNSKVKRNKVRINPSFANDFEPLARSEEMKSLLLSTSKPLTSSSFSSKEFRSGVIIIGNKMTHFISRNNKCYIIRKGLTIQELLTFFMKPQLADALLSETEKAIVNIKDALTFEDTRSFNNPYHLFIERAS